MRWGCNEQQTDDDDDDGDGDDDDANEDEDENGNENGNGNGNENGSVGHQICAAHIPYAHSVKRFSLVTQTTMTMLCGVGGSGCTVGVSLLLLPRNESTANAQNAAGKKRSVLLENLVRVGQPPDIEPNSS
ncbi:GH17127 [Drosophila grimshawi]|uniref:GH17127 n=1 Tax=Drosophila grimshawi TaxID=7222 RepID=B4J0P0_DROGR|nr:GH17127 [Drosophila grimshawi]